MKNVGYTAALLTLFVECATGQASLGSSVSEEEIETILETAVDVADSGGSYDEAMQAFEDVLGSVVATGRFSANEVATMLNGASLIVNRCWQIAGFDGGRRAPI